jgi:Protein of unknown function (DUF3102)
MSEGPEQAAFLAETADAIRGLTKNVVRDVLEIGRRLTQAKERVGHGNWLPWLEREFGWMDKTAEKWMNVYALSLKFELWFEYRSSAERPLRARREINAR